MQMLKTVLGTQEALDSWLPLLKVATFFLPAALQGKRFAGKGAKVHRVEMNHSGRWGRVHVGFGFDLLLNPKSRAYVFSVLPELTGFSLLPCFHRINLWSPELIGNAEVDSDRLPVDKTPRWSGALGPLRSTAPRSKHSLPCKAVVTLLTAGLGAWRASGWKGNTY